MFCNTFILLCDIFMSKVLRLRILLQSKDLLIFIVFGLGSKLETN